MKKIKYILASLLAITSLAAHAEVSKPDITVTKITTTGVTSNVGFKVKDSNEWLKADAGKWTVTSTDTPVQGAIGEKDYSGFFFQPENSYSGSTSTPYYHFTYALADINDPANGIVVDPTTPGGTLLAPRRGGIADIVPETSNNSSSDTYFVIKGNNDLYVLIYNGKVYGTADITKATKFEAYQLANADHNVSCVQTAVPATCTAGGHNAVYQCSICQKYFKEQTCETETTLADEEIPAGHTLTAYNAVAPTSSKDGNIAYWSCSKCGKYFSDEACQDEISENSWVRVLVSGAITWDDSNNQDGKRPESVTINLLRGGEQTDKSVTVTGDDNWAYSFTDLPGYNGESRITYTISANDVNDYTPAVDVYNVTYNHTPETINIIYYIHWVDNYDEAGDRPDDVALKLYKDGQPMSVDGDPYKYEKEYWAVSYIDYPKYSGGKLIEYTCEVPDIDSYTVAIEGDIVTYTHHTFVPVMVDENPSFTWADDCSAASLNLMCSDPGCNVTLNVDATITSEATTAPTADAPGVLTYTATASYRGTAYTGSKTLPIPATAPTTSLAEGSPTLLADGSWTLFNTNVGSDEASISVVPGTAESPTEANILLQSTSASPITLTASISTTANSAIIIQALGDAPSTITGDVTSEGTINIKGANVDGTVTSNGTGSNVNINSCTVEGSVTANNGAELNITGGKINGSAAAINGGKLDITGGTINGSVTANSGSITLSDANVNNPSGPAITATAGSTIYLGPGTYVGKERAVSILGANSSIVVKEGYQAYGGSNVNGPFTVIDGFSQRQASGVMGRRTSANNVPAEVTDYAPDYKVIVVRLKTPWLCFTAQEANSTVALTKMMEPTKIFFETSTDGSSWTPYAISDFGGTTITLDKVGDKVYFRNSSSTAATSFNMSAGVYMFTMSGKIAASGNVMSLMDKTCAATAFDATDGQYAFGGLFNECTSLTTAPELPATTLAANCYNSMFYGCTSLTTAPELPATTMADNCYFLMFNGCTSLTTVPELPATTMAEKCYYGMFRDCSALKMNTSGPGYAWSIPSTATGTNSWNEQMFANTAGTLKDENNGEPTVGTTYYLASTPNVKLNSAGYATYSTYFNATIDTEGVKAYKATIEGSTITLTELDGAIPAGTGVLLYGSGKGGTSVTFSPSADAATNASDNALKPTTITPCKIEAKPTDKVVFALASGNVFKNYTGAGFVHNRAYFQFDTNPLTSSDVKAFNIIFADEETTAIHDSQFTGGNEVRNTKRLENGRIVILKNGMKYNTNGQQLK